MYVYIYIYMYIARRPWRAGEKPAARDVGLGAGFRADDAKARAVRLSVTSSAEP